MCIPYRELDSKSRRILALGNLSLVVGLLLGNFRSYIQFQRDWLDAACGLFLGFSITVNLMLLRRRRHSSWPEPPADTGHGV
jgi:hypothetical protein